mmetsp:Transcript_7072/g.31222  ORF Transcript_7072/g.31222 Transcript_7072/m.31222 type:complete len:84 (+) Transcript_7072:1836-2087(+)
MNKSQFALASTIKWHYRAEQALCLASSELSTDPTDVVDVLVIDAGIEVDAIDFLSFIATNFQSKGYPRRFQTGALYLLLSTVV